MPLRPPIRALSAVALGSLCVALFAATAAAAPRDSIKLVLPKHLHPGVRVALVLTGYASGKRPEVSLYSQPQPCRSSFTSENKFHNPTIWIDGGHVNGHYRYTDRVGFSESTTSKRHFCAYLTSFTPTFSYITEAHEALHFDVAVG